MMLVVALVSLIVGMGLGAYAAFDFGELQLRGQVVSALRATRNEAAAHRTRARVRVEPAAGLLRAEALAVVGTWHFEAEPLDGFGGRGALAGAQLVEDGWLGSALSLPGGGAGARAEFPVQADPAWELGDGLRIECALRTDGTGRGAVLSLGDSAGLVVGSGGRLGAWIQRRELDETGAALAGVPVTVESARGVLPEGRWTRVAFEYDRRALRLEVEGVVVAELVEEAEVWPLEGPLVLGHPSRGFGGAIDALVVSVRESAPAVQLPDGVRFDAAEPFEVRFGPGGELDRGHHDGPVTVALLFEDGARREVRVGWWGTIE
jgi:hypothetical protein